MPNRPGRAEMLPVPPVLLDMRVPLGRLGVGGRNSRNDHQGGRASDQDRKPDRKLAHKIFLQFKDKPEPAEYIRRLKLNLGSLDVVKALGQGFREGRGGDRKHPAAQLAKDQFGGRHVPRVDRTADQAHAEITRGRADLDLK